MFRLIVLLSLCCISGILTAQSRKPFSIGETWEMKASVLGESRSINVYLPISYAENPDKRYPVIYLLDGSRDEDFIHIAGLVQFCSFSWIGMIPETIVVGISNVDRKRDFTYPSSKKQDLVDLPTSGGSAKFISFIQQELQPKVDQMYRTTNRRTLIGQSLGGLLATEILLSKPDMFDQYIIVSPSLWWDNEKLLKTPIDKDLADVQVYVAVGKEGKVMERVAQSLADKLRTHKQSPEVVYFQFFEAQNHGDALHLAVYDVFQQFEGRD